MLDMLYSKNNTPGGLKSPGLESALKDHGITSMAGRLSRLQSLTSQPTEDTPSRADLEIPEGTAQAARTRLAEEQRRMLRPQYSIEAETHSQSLEKTMMTPLSRGSQDAWEKLQPSSRPLRIKDLDFSDLMEEEDIDVLDIDTFDTGLPNGVPPPPSSSARTGLCSPTATTSSSWTCWSGSTSTSSSTTSWCGSTPSSSTTSWRIGCASSTSRTPSVPISRE